MNARSFYTLLVLLFTSALATWAQDETIDFSAQGFYDGEVVDEVSGSECVVEFSLGSNSYRVSPKYYVNGEAVRVYAGNTMTVTSTTSKSIEKIVLCFGQYHHNVVSADSGTYIPDTGENDGQIYSYGEDTWMGKASEVYFSIGGSSGHCKLQKLKIWYIEDVASPEISGLSPFDISTTVTITCDTEGAAIYYTTDGSIPSAESRQYTAPISITETTTISAIAIKDEVSSSVVTKTFVNNAGLWTQGSGTAADPYLISNTDQLDQLATRVNNGQTYEGVYFKQTADLVYDGSTNNYNPIGYDDGNSSYYFQGTYDGGGYSISGINIYKNGTSETDKYKAIFGLVGYYAVIKNLTITSSTLTGYRHVGGIAGYSEGRIENCHATATVSIHSVVDGAMYHGGIAGCNGKVLYGCSSAASIEVDGDFETAEYNGGITGWSWKGNHIPYMYYCLYTGSNVEGTHYYGTIAGKNDYQAKDCYYVEQPNSLEAIGGWNNSTDNPNANDLCAYTISCCTDGVTLLFDGDVPNSDIIEMYGNMMAYDGVYYIPEGKTVTFTLATELDCTFGNVTTSGGTLISNNDGSYTLTMPNANVIINVTLLLTLKDNEDNSSMLVDNDGVTADVTLSGRTLYKDGSWNTLCLPFDVLDFTDSPLEGAMVKTLESSAFDKGILTLNFTQDANNLTSIEAGVPYIVRWASGDPIIDPTFENVTIKNTLSPVTTDEVSFSGLYSPLTVGKEKPVTYTVAELSGTTLTFKVTDVAPDGVTSWDASNTSDTPGWNRSDASTIEKVVFDPSFAKARPKNCSGWFFNTKVGSFSGMEYFNTSEVTNMYRMFGNCLYLGSVDVSHFDTRKVTNMGMMFYCFGGSTLDLSSFNTSNVENMTEMFGACVYLKTIYVSSEWSVANVTDSDMFRRCESLKGGAGTVFDAGHIDEDYAHIDGGTGNPGYLTEKAKPSYESADEEEDFSDRTVLYLGASNTLYYPTEAVTIGAFRAYFKLQGDLIAGDPVEEDETGQHVRSFKLNFGDETEISEISDRSKYSDRTEGWYTLDGRHLNGKPSQRGIFIVNGEKVVIQ